MASSGVVSMLKSQFKIGAELPISFSTPPATMSQEPPTDEKKDDEDEGSEKSEVPESITIDISGSNVTEPKTIVHV
jgi:hypothetical protein